MKCSINESIIKGISEEDLKKVHTASPFVLERTGMQIDHKKASDMLQDAGANVDHGKKL
jgi:trimethylamine:corrinoid methyltransferase-like protein